MRHWLYHYDIVNGAPAVLEDTLLQRVRGLLVSATDADTKELTRQGDVLVPLPARVLGLDVHKTVRVRTGVAERHGARVSIPLHWHAEPGRKLFPSFAGTIELDPQSSWMAHLAIVGAATLPLGPVGAAVGATALRDVADRTVRHLVTNMVTALEQAVTESADAEAASGARIGAGDASKADAAAPARPATAPGAERATRARRFGQLSVRDVMTPLPLVLHESMPLKTAALLLFHYDIAGAPVQSDSGGLVGVLSEADLIDVEAPLRHGIGHEVTDSRRRKLARTVGEACSRPAAQVAATTTVRDAAALLRERNVARLVVVDDSAIAGVVSRHDVLEALVREDSETQGVLDELIAQFGEPHVTVVLDRGIAYLRGSVSMRSRAAKLAELVEDVDGVIAVEEADLRWEVDDLLPPVTPIL